MASKRHSGLGRGLDALFPVSEEGTQDQKVRNIASHETSDLHHDAKKTLHDTDESLRNESHHITIARLSRIEPNREQPRKRFDEQALEELAQSIRQHGLIQPILVQDRGSYYEIIAGERRWRAARKAGLREVPVIVKNYTDQEITELSLIENIQREDLNAIEEARAYQMLIQTYHLTQAEVAQKVSKSRTAITNIMRLLNLDGGVQDMVIDGRLSMGQARALLPVEDKEKQRQLAGQIAEEKPSVREVEKMVKHYISERDAAKITSGSTSNTSKYKQKSSENNQMNLIYRDLENRLTESLHTKVSIHPEGNPGGHGAGKLEIEFYSGDDLEQIVDLLTRHTSINRG